MELNKDLQILIELARELYDKINNEIQHDVISFCRNCKGQGLLCGIPEITLEERERLVAVRDSLKDVQGMLVFLQKLELCHQGNICSALARLDQSRMYLIERINQYPNHDRKLDVLEELHACFGDWKTSPNWNFIERKKEKIEQKAKNGISHFLVTWIRSLFSPRIWYHATHMAIKVIVISAGVSSTIYIHRTMTKSEYKRTRENNIVSSLNSRMVPRQKFLPTDSNSPLAVLHGRG